MRVIDSSVLAAFILKEPGWERLTGHLVGVTLDIAFLEASNAIVKALRRGRIDSVDASIMFSALSKLKTMRVESGIRFLEQSMEIAFKSRLTIYDALFVALARETKLPLVTLDRMQHDEAVKLGVPSTLLVP